MTDEIDLPTLIKRKKNIKKIKEFSYHGQRVFDQKYNKLLIIIVK